MVLKMYKLIIVDDHSIFRNSLKALLEKEEIAEVIADADNGNEFLGLLEKHHPDIVLMDIAMPVLDGIEATKVAISLYPKLNILTLSSFGEENYYYKMVEAGVKGFLLKDADISELKQAIEIVAKGGSYFSSELLKKVITNIVHTKKIESNLTKREIAIVKMVCSGLTNEQIADQIHLSYDTIRWHRSNILSKTGCNNTASLVMYAIKNNLVSLI
jgi:DNA-binding NarL/FixJ family response regulator